MPCDQGDTSSFDLTEFNLRVNYKSLKMRGTIDEIIKEFLYLKLKYGADAKVVIQSDSHLIHDEKR